MHLSYDLQALLLLLSLSSSFTSFNIYLVHGEDSTLAKSREALEIVIGVGGGTPSPPDSPGSAPPETPCPPPPSPYPFESKRIELVYPVIQKLKSKIKCDPKGITKTWVGPDICNKYQGFSCAKVPDFGVQALAAVYFNEYYFAGDDLTLDGFLEELPDLTIFHANSNNFTGTIPANVGKLRYLYELDLSNNLLMGQFPYQVLAATKLTFLDVRFNQFAGVVPPQIFTLDLDFLFMNDNNFSQKLPENLGSTPVLYLTLANNRFIGPIPRSIGKACNTLLQVLFLNNQLSGCLPYEIGLLYKVIVFDAGNNQLTGPIPLSFGCLKKMEVLNLAQNKLYGSVPDGLCKLPKLVNLSLSFNYFTEIGPECWKLVKSKVLDVKMNCIPYLPNQRSPAECAAFFSKPKYCPNWNSVPCSTTNAIDETSEKQHDRRPPAGPSSYNSLNRHRL